jgi:hypothetical protein
MDTKALIRQAEQGDPRSRLKLGQILLTETFPDITNACIHWLEKAADRPYDLISSTAMKELVRIYLLYPGADAPYIITRFQKFVKRKNPVAMLEMGRILFADETSPYIKKFGKGGELYKAQLTIGTSQTPPIHLKESDFKLMGFALIDEAANLSEKSGKNNPFDSADFCTFSDLYTTEAMRNMHYLGKNNSDFQALIDKQLFYAQKAVNYLKNHYADKEHTANCKAQLIHAQKLKSEYKPK